MFFSRRAASAGFFTAIDNAAQFYESAYTDSITINMQVGWGLIDGRSLNPGDFGQSQTNQTGVYGYATIKNALTLDSKSADDATAVANLPANYPVSNASFVMSDAEAKALGLLSGSATGIDGYIGFDSKASYTFDPNNRAVAGEYDVTGLAEHEVSEVMGRYGLGQNGASSGRYSPIDLFRYTSAGVLDTVRENGDYFSINNGVSNINTYNGTGGGDLSDWSGRTLDSYNAFFNSGVEMPVSAGDLTLMDVIGYDRAVPEPASMTLLAVGAIGLLTRRNRRA